MKIMPDPMVNSAEFEVSPAERYERGVALKKAGLHKAAIEQFEMAAVDTSLAVKAMRRSGSVISYPADMRRRSRRFRRRSNPHRPHRRRRFRYSMFSVEPWNRWVGSQTRSKPIAGSGGKIQPIEMWLSVLNSSALVAQQRLRKRATPKSNGPGIKILVRGISSLSYVQDKERRIVLSPYVERIRERLLQRRSSDAMFSQLVFEPLPPQVHPHIDQREHLIPGELGKIGEEFFKLDLSPLMDDGE